MKRWKRLAAGALAFVLASGGGTSFLGEGLEEVRADNCGGLLEEDVYTPDPEEVIQDPILHWAVRSAMNAVKSGVKLTAEMVGDPSVQYISYELCNHPEDFAGWTQPYWVESLEGLQYAKSATMVDICYTSNIEGKKIESVEPLATLTQLDTLYLKQDGIRDISPLKGLVNLEQLDVSGNYEIRDISAVTDMKKLKTLDISINSVSDLDPVSGLSKLERLNAGNNGIQTLPDLSGLTSLTALDLSGNQITDVSALAALGQLKELNLSGNDGLTDVKALAGLKHLEKGSTYLPTEQMKEDLFAAIDTNKLFLTFNISKMTSADLENVDKALQAYEALTDEQKTYMDQGMIQAAKSNKELVEAGNAPQYYPEYDQGGEPVPVFDRITIQAVDKNGTPIKDVEFIREEVGGWGVPETRKTDESGKIVYEHASIDKWATFEVYPAGDVYVSSPEKITYYVDENGNTGEVNGKPATGLEQLTFILIPEEEYVDKTELETTLNECGNIKEEEAYRYTAESWSAYQQALNRAQAALGNPDATNEEVDQAATDLRSSYEGLQKTDVLTKIKITVKDTNGNIFTRPFKFQIREKTNHASAWNIESDGRTGVVYLTCSPAWRNGQEWEILACDEEPYQFTSIYAVIGVKDGKTYFKTVDGQAQGPDFEKVIQVEPVSKPTATREKDSSVLKDYIAQAGGYKEADYTPGTWEKFAEALATANTAVTKGTTQEDYNKAAAELLKAEAELRTPADKSILEYELNYSWTAGGNYTPGSWQRYQEAVTAARKVYNDPEATQEAVDAAVKAIREADDALVLKPNNKPELEQKIQQAESLEESDYAEGWDKLQEALEEAREVLDDQEASQQDVADQIRNIEDAIAGLKEKPEQPEEGVLSDETTFRALVLDENGNPVPGIQFVFTTEDPWIGPYTAASGDDGMLVLEVNPYDYLLTFTVSMQADQTGWICEETHSFTTGGSAVSGAPIETIDGKPLSEAGEIVFTLKKEGGSEPEINTDALKAKIDEAKAIQPDVYTQESYQKLQDAIAEAEAVLAAPVSQNEVEEQTAKLQTAIEGLEEKQEQPSEGVFSDAATFRALVKDEQGNPVEGVRFVFDTGSMWTEPSTKSSNADGILEYELGWDYGLTFTVSMADGQEPWICADTHTFTISELDYTSYAAAEIIAIDGKPLSEAGEIIFTLKKEGGSEPAPGVSKDNLEGWLGSAATYPESDYTADSYAPLKEAVAEGERIMNDPDATQEEIDAAVEAIEKAINSLVKADLPVYCEKTNIRIKVVFEDGTTVPNDVAFTMDKGGYGSYNATTYDGQIGYMLNTQDVGMESMSVYLKDGVTVINGKEYVAEPEQFVFTFKYVDPGVEIDTIDGQPFTGQEQLIFTLKEKAEDPAVNKDELNRTIAEAQERLAEEDGYTLNSFNAMKQALDEATKIAEDETASQKDVDQAGQTLRNAIDSLKKIQGMQTLVIPVSMQDGTTAENIEFVRRSEDYGVNQKLFANGGQLEWTPGTYDSGEFSFYLPETSAYIATPERIYVQLGDEDGSTVIETINGVPAASAQAAFVLTEKGTDTSDILHFRAVVQDMHGNLLPDIRFDVENGDPAQIVSDENGVIEYQVTAWDTDCTMTVKLQESQGWIADKAVSFSVIVDPDDPGRGIIDTIDGVPLAESGKIVFRLQEENEETVDFSGLSEVMEQAARLDADQYTEESFAAVNDALTYAKTVLGNSEASQEDVDRAKADLEEAIANLVEKEDPGEDSGENPGEDPGKDPGDPEDPNPGQKPDPEQPGQTGGNGDGQTSVGNGTGNAGQNQQVKAVRTGDTRSAAGWCFMAAVSLVAAVTVIKRRR